MNLNHASVGTLQIRSEGAGILMKAIHLNSEVLEGTRGHLLDYLHAVEGTGIGLEARSDNIEKVSLEGGNLFAHASIQTILRANYFSLQRVSSHK